MPSAFVKKAAEELGKSTDWAEGIWKKAKKVVDEQYDTVDSNSDRYWKLVTSIFKQMAGLKEHVRPQLRSFKSFLIEVSKEHAGA